MIGKKNVVKIARHVLRRGQDAADQKVMHPVRDWTVGLVVASTLFMGFSAYAGFTFASKYRGVDVVPPFDNSIVVYKRNEAQEILVMYQNRKAEFETLRAERRNITVTSLDTESEDVPVESAEGEGANLRME